MNAIFNFTILIILAVGSTATAQRVGVYQCANGELDAIDSDSQQSFYPRTEQLATKYNDLLKEHGQNPPRAIANALATLRKDMRYDSVSRYLFDDQARNPKKEYYNKVIERQRGSDRFYLQGERVIAKAIKTEDGRVKVTRFNTDCSIKEVVVLKSYEPDGDYYMGEASPSPSTATGRPAAPGPAGSRQPPSR